MKQRTLLWALLFGTVVTVCVAFLRTAKSPRSGDLPVYGNVADFAFSDEKNQRMTRKDLEGKIWVADFIYTTCPDQCRRMSRSMAKVQSLLPKEAPVRLVSVSVDPQHDTPKVLSAYAKSYKAESGRWHFLTGSEKAVAALAANLNVGPSVKTPETGLIDHSSRLVLIDPESRIRGYYDGTQAGEVQKLVKDVSRLSPNPVK